MVYRYPSSTGSERGRRLRTALSMAESIDEARRLEQRRKIRERKAMMEKERKKAVRAAKQKLKEQKYAQRNPNWRPVSEMGMLSTMKISLGFTLCVCLFAC